MAKEVKLVAESLQEWETAEKEVKELNEGSKASLKKFLNNPEKNSQSFLKAFKEQIKKFGIADTVNKLDKEEKIKLAKKALVYLKQKPGMDILNLPLKKVSDPEADDEKIVVDVSGDITGKGIGRREGIHGGTSVKA